MAAHLANDLYWKPDAEQVLLAVIFQFPFDDQLNLKRGHTSVSALQSSCLEMRMTKRKECTSVSTL